MLSRRSVAAIVKFKLDRKLLSALTGMIFATLLLEGNVCADIIGEFKDLQTQGGEWGWDDFGTTGSAYSDAHLADQFGSGSSISASPAGGLITSTKNLYSMFTVPTFSVDLSGLDDTDNFTSLVVQFAASGSYDASHFSLDGNNPDELVTWIGTQTSGDSINMYWAEWQGLTADTDYSVSLQGTGQHQSLAGVKASYFNTGNSAFNMTPVPEPGTFTAMGLLAGMVALRRRRS